MRVRISAEVPRLTSAWVVHNRAAAWLLGAKHHNRWSHAHIQTHTHSHGKPRAASRLPPPGGLRTGPKAGARVRGPRQRLVPKLALRITFSAMQAKRLNQDLRCVALHCVAFISCCAMQAKRLVPTLHSVIWDPRLLKNSCHRSYRDGLEKGRRDPRRGSNYQLLEPARRKIATQEP